MRTTLTVTILLAVLLAGCAARKDGPGNKNISQAGALMVHPGLVVQPDAVNPAPNSGAAISAPPKKID